MDSAVERYLTDLVHAARPLVGVATLSTAVFADSRIERKPAPAATTVGRPDVRATVPTSSLRRL